VKLAIKREIIITDSKILLYNRYRIGMIPQRYNNKKVIEIAYE